MDTIERTEREQVATLKVAEILDGPNPRKRRNAAADAELLESVRAQGVLQPVLVRPTPAGPVLVFGSRRLAAARAAGLEVIPAISRDMDDATMREIQLAENGSREDVHPIEEADTFGELVALGRTPEEIAQRCGKSVRHVRDRLRLLDLAPPARKALETDKLDAARALLIAALPKARHGEATRALTPDSRWHDGEPLSLRDCKRIIADEFMLRLDTAGWKLDDAELVAKAGPCTTCPKRSGKQGGLFDDVRRGGDVGLCFDAPCFEKKRKAHAADVIARARVSGIQVIEKASKLLTEWGDVQRSSGYVRLDAECHDDSKSRTWRKLIGKLDADAAANVERVVAISKKGDAIELAAEKPLRAALRKAGVKLGSAFEPSDRKGGDAKASAARKVEQLKARARREAAARIATAATNGEGMDRFDVWQTIALGAVESVWHDAQKNVCARRGIEVPKGKSPRDALRKWIEKQCWSVASAQALVLELLVCRDAYAPHLGFHDGNTPFQRALKIWGVQLATIEAELRAQDAEKKSEGKSAAKPKAAAKKKTAAKRRATKGAK